MPSVTTDPSRGHLYILESKHLTWAFWTEFEPDDFEGAPLAPFIDKAADVFPRAQWSGEGTWWIAPIPFLIGGKVVAVHEPGGLIYAWSTHELSWLDG